MKGYSFYTILPLLALMTGSAFITSCSNDDEGDNNGTVTATPRAVDLGLSVKWADRNVGAENPWDYGDYFAWGETVQKFLYDYRTYKWYDDSNRNFTKYCTDSRYGEVDNRTTLDPEDDAAHVNMGGSWRMPTDAEQEELAKKCTWTWTTQNGVTGYKVKSKSNGNSIFLPATGCRYDDSVDGVGFCGYYWSSSCDMSLFAYYLSISSDNVASYNFDRDCGLVVRAVCQ